MKNIILQYDSWYIALCLILGLVYAFTLYYKQKHLKDKSLLLVLFLSFLRFLSVLTIAFMLLAPLYKSVSEQKRKPVIVIGQDYSSSITNNYSQEDLRKYNREIHSAVDRLRGKFDVQAFSIGEKIIPGLRDSFDLKGTNLSSFLSYINESYDNNELSAVILSSDGIYNEGNNPVYSNIKFDAPIYTIALGDTTEKKDLIISNIFYNDYAFLEDKIAIKADIQAKNAINEKSVLKLYSISGNNQLKLLDRKNIHIKNNDFYDSYNFVINVLTPGINHYRLQLDKINGEVSVKNNVKDFYVEVVDSKLKIAIIANNPHPDISTIKDALLDMKNYSVDVLLSQNTINANAYDLLIFYNLPSSKRDINRIHNTALEKSIPELFIVGTKTNINELNNIQDLLEIKGNSNSFNEAQAVLNEDFSLFITDEFKDKDLENFPPLIVRFGEYQLSPDSRVLFYQKINNINTQYPLIILSGNTRIKIGIIAGTNLYKWRLFDFYQNKNNNTVKSVLAQIVQFLTVKKDKSQWRVKVSKNIYNESEPVVFSAELYNDNYEPINIPEAYLKIINDKGKEFDFVFSRRENHYEISGEKFPAGDYRYIATVKFSNKNLVKKGKFKIIRKELEKFDVVAKYNILNNLSMKTGGQIFGINQINKLVEKIDNENVKPIIYFSQKTDKLLNFKLIFWFILLLLSMEWFIRRYNGTF